MGEVSREEFLEFMFEVSEADRQQTIDAIDDLTAQALRREASFEETVREIRYLCSEFTDSFCEDIDREDG
jgi:hypothetical protein